MTDNIVNLQGDEYNRTGHLDDEIRQSVVATLEKLLEMAKSGQINAVAASVSYTDGTFNSEFAGEPVSRGTVGMLELMKTQLANELIKDGMG